MKEEKEELNVEKWHPVVFSAVHKYKSIFRAFRRGQVDYLGNPLPKRLFHNRPNRSTRKGVHSRTVNELKKRIYADVRRAQEERRVQ